MLTSKELYFPSAHVIITKRVHMSLYPYFLKEYLLHCSGAHSKDLLTDLHLYYIFKYDYHLIYWVLVFQL